MLANEWGIVFTPDEINSAEFGAPPNEAEAIVLGRYFLATLNGATRSLTEERAAYAEERILAGESDFMVGNVRYAVPDWRRNPIKRLRVEWARWKARR